MQLHTAENALKRTYEYLKGLVQGQCRFYSSSIEHIRTIRSYAMKILEYCNALIKEDSETKHMSESLVEVKGIYLRLQKNIEELKDSKMPLQNESVEMLYSILDSCEATQEVIHNLLDLKCPNTYQRTFPPKFEDALLMFEQIQNSLNSLQTDVNHIQNQISDNSEIHEENAEAVESSQSSDVSEVSNSTNSQNFVNTSASGESQPSKKQEGNRSKKEAYSTYCKVLTDLPDSIEAYPKVGKCSKLLKDWFTGRFITYREGHNYNIEHMPDWITSIVSCYSHSIDTGQEEQFLHRFYSWLDSLESNQRYSVPYEIYQHMSEDCDKHDKNSLTSLVMWDMLADNGLSKLFEYTDRRYFPYRDSLMDKAFKYCPKILNDYENYRVCPEIIDKCKIGESSNA